MFFLSKASQKKIPLLENQNVNVSVIQVFVSLLIVDCLNSFLAKSSAELLFTLTRQDQGHNFYQDEHIPYEYT